MSRFTYLLTVVLLLISTGAFSAQDLPATLGSKYAGLSAGPLATATLTALPAGVLLSADDLTISATDMEQELAKAGPDMKKKFASYGFFVLEQMAVQKLLDMEVQAWAKKQGVSGSPDELAKQYLDQATGAVGINGDEVDEFCRKNPAVVKGRTFDEVRPKVTELLMKQKHDAAVDTFVKTIGGRHPIKIADEWAATQYAQWIKNPVETARNSGKPALVQFAASGDPAAEKMTPVLTQLQETHKASLVVVTIQMDDEPVLALHYNALSTPTQLLYDKTGKLFLKHGGFYEEADLKTKLKEIGVE